MLHYNTSSNIYNSIEQRFWDKVNIADDQENDDCWNFKILHKQQGIGRFKLNGRSWEAYRIAYEIAYGEIPSGLLVRHMCNNKACVRPEHLILGTLAENNRDKIIFNRGDKISVRNKKFRVVKNTMSLEEIKLWNKIILPKDNNIIDCWWWIANTTENGYGRLRFRNKMILAHRLMYELFHDFCIMPYILACHTCDHPNCVNPHHIFLGDHVDNANDMVAKGRGNYYRGKKARGRKFKAEDIEKVLSLRSDGLTYAKISEIVPISISHISNIINGRYLC